MATDAGRSELVVVLVTPQGPGSGGGTQQVLRRMLPRWIAQGRSVTVLTHPIDERWDGLGTDIEFHALPGPAQEAMRSSLALIASLSATLRTVRSIRRQVRHRPRAVVLPFLPGSAIVTLLATFGLPNRVIPCERNDPDRQQFSPIVELLRRVLYRRASALTVNSAAAQEGVRQLSNGRIPVHVVLNPLPDWARTGTIAPGERVILSMGRLVRQKRHDVTIRAFARLGDAADGWHLDVVGDGPERDSLRDLARKLGVEDRVRFRGHQQDVAPILSAASILVLGSEYEGTPNVLLEALLSGVACLVSDAIPGLPEGLVADPPAEVFPVGDVAALERLLATRIAESDPASMASQTRRVQRLVGQERYQHAVVSSWDAALADRP